MTGWVFLLSAILSEVVATLSLRVAASEGAKIFLVPVVTGYVGSFALLALALEHGLALGLAYGVWTAAGAAVTAVASRVLFREPLTVLMGLGIAVIAGGVLLVEMGSAH